MEKEKESIENDLETSIEDNSSLVDEKNERIAEIEYRLQDLEIIVDQLEQKVLEDMENSEYLERFTHAKDEYKSLLKERKALVREVRSLDISKANQISTWIYFYGIFIFIFCFPFLSYTIWLEFATAMINWVSSSLGSIEVDSFLYYVVTFLLVFSLPLILLIGSWMLYLNLMRKPLDKKTFIWLWIIQGLLTVSMIIYISIRMFGN